MTLSLIVDNMTEGSAEGCDTVLTFAEGVDPVNAFELHGISQGQAQCSNSLK